jgi:hypothetical protein
MIDIKAAIANAYDADDKFEAEGLAWIIGQLIIEGTRSLERTDERVR